VYHLTLTENRDVEATLAKTNDPESFRSLLLVTTQLEDIVESTPDIVYPVWSALRLPYVITNGPGRKCTAAEMVSAPVWDSELNWMDVLGHLSKIIPAVREAVVQDNASQVPAVNARIETELTPLLFEMTAVAPVLVGEVEALLGKERQQVVAADDSSKTVEQDQREIAQVEVDQEAPAAGESVVANGLAAATAMQTSSADIATSGQGENEIAASDQKKPKAPAEATKVATKVAKSKNSKPSTAAKKKSAAQKPTVTSAAGRRALAVSIAETEAANDQYAHQLSLPLFA